MEKKQYEAPCVNVTEVAMLHLLAASSNGFNLFEFEGDHPFDAAPPFFHSPFSPPNFK